MRYTIIFKNKEVFHTNWINFENDWNNEFHFIVINNVTNQYTIDGETWTYIEDDHL